MLVFDQKASIVATRPVSPTGSGGMRQVTTLLTGDRLKTVVREGNYIKHGDIRSVEGAKYDLRLSGHFLKASFGRPTDIEKLSETERLQARVDPGEVVFVRTMEEIELPENVIAFLSPKRKIIHTGIFVLCGFCIDPLFKGPLWVGLYNFSSTPFHLQAGKKLIAALFYELSGDELTEFPVPVPQSDDEFPEDLVSLIRSYKPVELRSLIEEVAATKRDVNDLRQLFTSDKQWKDDFKSGLEELKTIVSGIAKNLESEVIAREKEDSHITKRLDDVGDIWRNIGSGFGIAKWAVALALGAFISWLVMHYLATSPK